MSAVVRGGQPGRGASAPPSPGLRWDGSRAGGTRDLTDITLLDVYEAVEPEPGLIFALHRSTPDPECLVGHSIGPAMTAIYSEIEATLRKELARTTLEDILRDILQSA